MGRIFYMISRAAAKCILHGVGRIRVLHPERSAIPGGVLLAENHISHFDPPLISVAARRPIDWMAMRELFVPGLASAWLNAVGAFPNDRKNVDRASVRTALQRLKMGRIVGIFPEGGLRAGEHSVLNGAPFHPGLAAIAGIAGVPVLPCVVLGSDRLYRKQSWFKPRNTPLWVAFGNPLPPPSHAQRSQFKNDFAVSMRSLVEELREHAGVRDEDLPQTPQERKPAKKN